MTLLRALLAIAIAVVVVSCDTTAPVDMYFDSSVGADYVPPPADAAPDAVDAAAVN
jgi:hypothetical protein